MPIKLPAAGPRTAATLTAIFWAAGFVVAGIWLPLTAALAATGADVTLNIVTMLAVLGLLAVTSRTRITTRRWVPTRRHITVVLAAGWAGTGLFMTFWLATASAGAWPVAWWVVVAVVAALATWYTASPAPADGQEG